MLFKYIKFLFAGTLFGITLAKAEVISWYRIFEMFHFDSFHMYGVIGSAVALGVPLVAFIKKKHMHSLSGREITFTPKNKSVARYVMGGTIFGLGWALVGACPGPMYILVGYGFSVMLVVIFSAIAGTFVYGLLRNRLPH